ncbi:MAG: ABC transporter ATP-binding protein, partial [Bacteroidota bacterium]
SEKKKLTWKEQRELEALEIIIAELESKKHSTMELLNSGTLSAEELQKKAKDYAEIEKQLEEKENRWLELSQWL